MKRTITLVGAAIIATFACVASIDSPARSQQLPNYIAANGYHQSQMENRVVGVVTGFRSYRMTVQRASGQMQTIDLKNGTLIRPMGATPTQGEMAIVHGYYSNGTFIANSISLRV